MNDRSRGEPSPAVARKPAAPGRQPVRARARRPVAPDNLQVVQLARAGGSAPVAALPGTPLGNQEEQDRVTRARSAPGRCGDCAVAARHFGVQAKCAGCAEKARAVVQPACDTCDSDAPNLDAARPAVADASQPLPHQSRIQASFGKHDLSGVRTVTGGAARDANDDIGARAFTAGDRIGFRDTPDEWLAAHESAHVIQQREGTSMPGDGGDAWERHADQVADSVVAGRSAEPLLDEVAGGDGERTPALQLDDEKDKGKDKDKQDFSNEAPDDFANRVRAMGAARLAQNIATLGQWKVYVQSMLSDQLQAQMLSSVVVDSMTTAMSRPGGDQLFEKWAGTHNEGDRLWAEARLRSDWGNFEKRGSWEAMVRSHAFGYWTDPSMAEKFAVSAKRKDPSTLPDPEWRPGYYKFHNYKDVYTKVDSGGYGSGGGCQYCHDLNHAIQATIDEYGDPYPENPFDDPQKVSEIATGMYAAHGSALNKQPTGGPQLPPITDPKMRDYLIAVMNAEPQTSPSPSKKWWRDDEDDQQPAAPPPPQPQQQAPATPAASTVFAPPNAPLPVTVPPPRTDLCGKPPEDDKDALPSPHLEEWGPASADVAKSLAVIGSALTPLGPRGYRVLTSLSFDALWSLKPHQIEEVRQAILGEIDVRIGKYSELAKQISSPDYPYYQLCPIVDELLPSTSDIARLQAQIDIAQWKSAQLFLDIAELVLTGLTLIFPPSAVVTLPTMAALGLVRVGLGFQQVDEGKHYQAGTGAKIFTPEQEAEADSLVTMGKINVVTGLFSMVTSAAGVAALGDTPQSMIRVIKTPAGYMVTHKLYPGAVLWVEGNAVELVNEGGDVVAHGVISNGKVWMRSGASAGQAGAAAADTAGASTAMVPYSGATSMVPYDQSAVFPFLQQPMAPKFFPPFDPGVMAPAGPMVGPAAKPFWALPAGPQPAGLLGGRFIPGELGVVTGGSSTTLGKNLMQDMGLPRSMKWSGYQAQHIIPSQMKTHPVIKKIGMDFDNVQNGMFLPEPKPDVAHALATHQGFHSVYNDAVKIKLDQLEKLNLSTGELEQRVYKLQSRLRYLCAQGTPLYDWNGGTVALWLRLLDGY